jgi:hypothetical protein
VPDHVHDHAPAPGDDHVPDLGDDHAPAPVDDAAPNGDEHEEVLDAICFPFLF